MKFSRILLRAAAVATLAAIVSLTGGEGAGASDTAAAAAGATLVRPGGVNVTEGGSTRVVVEVRRNGYTGDLRLGVGCTGHMLPEGAADTTASRGVDYQVWRSYGEPEWQVEVPSYRGVYYLNVPQGSGVVRVYFDISANSDSVKESSGERVTVCLLDQTAAQKAADASYWNARRNDSQRNIYRDLGIHITEGPGACASHERWVAYRGRCVANSYLSVRDSRGNVVAQNVSTGIVRPAYVWEGGTVALTIFPRYDVERSPLNCIWSFPDANGRAKFTEDFTVTPDAACGTNLKISVKAKRDDATEPLESVRLRITQYDPDDRSRIDSVERNIIYIRNGARSGGYESCTPLTRGRVGQPLTFDLGYKWSSRKDRQIFLNGEAYSYNLERENTLKYYRESGSSRNRFWSWPRNPIRAPRLTKVLDDHQGYWRQEANQRPGSRPRISGMTFSRRLDHDIRFQGNRIEDNMSDFGGGEWTPRHGGYFSFEEAYRERGRWHYHTCAFQIKDTEIWVNPVQVAENGGATTITVWVKLLEAPADLPRGDTAIYWSLGPGSGRRGAEASDFTLSASSGTIIVPGGSDTAYGSATLTITPVDDTAYEGDEYLSLGAYSPGRDVDVTGRFKIVDDDTYPSLRNVHVSGTLSEPTNPLQAAAVNYLTFTGTVGRSRTESYPAIAVLVGHNPSARPPPGRSNALFSPRPNSVSTMCAESGSPRILRIISHSLSLVGDYSFRSASWDGIQALPCLKWNRPVREINVPRGAVGFRYRMPVSVKYDSIVECDEDAVFTLWAKGASGTAAVRVPIADRQCVKISMEGNPVVTEGGTAEIKIKAVGGHTISYRLRAKICAPYDMAATYRGYRCNNVIAAAPEEDKIWFSPLSPVWVSGQRQVCVRSNREYVSRLRVPEDAVWQGEDSYILITAEAVAGGRCVTPRFTGKTYRNNLGTERTYLGSVLVRDNDSPPAEIALDYVHTTRENGDGPGPDARGDSVWWSDWYRDDSNWDTRYFRIVPEGTTGVDLSSVITEARRIGCPTCPLEAGLWGPLPSIYSAGPTGMAIHSERGPPGVWKINRWDENGVYLDIAGDDLLGDHRVVLWVWTRPSQNIRFAQEPDRLHNAYGARGGGVRRYIEITIVDDDGGWDPWAGSCRRNFGAGLTSDSWSSPPYASSSTDVNYVVHPVLYRHPALWSVAVPVPEGSAGRLWFGGGRIDWPGSGRYRISVIATETRIVMRILPAPPVDTVLRISGDGGRSVILDPTEGTRGGTPERPFLSWDTGDVYPAHDYGEDPWPENTNWTLTLYEAGAPPGLTATASGSGPGATVSLGGKPSQLGGWRMSLRPRRPGGEALLGPNAEAVEIICTHRVTPPAWEAELLGPAWGGSCDYQGTAVRPGGGYLYPTAAPPPYQWEHPGFAPRPRGGGARWSGVPNASSWGSDRVASNYGMTLTRAGWSGSPQRQFSATWIWEMADSRGRGMWGTTSSGGWVPVFISCNLRVGSPAEPEICEGVSPLGSRMDVPLLDYPYAGEFHLRSQWSPSHPRGVTLRREGGRLSAHGALPSAGIWRLTMELTTPEGRPLLHRLSAGGWSRVRPRCALRAVAINLPPGASPPSATSSPGAALGPHCAVPGDTWETRMKAAGPGEIETIWRGFSPPGIDDPSYLEFWYPRPAQLRSDWLAPWEKPPPPPGEDYYPASGPFNDPAERGTWDTVLYRSEMRESWNKWFPESPLP